MLSNCSCPSCGTPFGNVTLWPVRCVCGRRFDQRRQVVLSTPPPSRVVSPQAILPVVNHRLSVCRTNDCGRFDNFRNGTRCMDLPDPCQLPAKVASGWTCPLGHHHTHGIEREQLDTRITIGITAFDRPVKLTACLESIWYRYPNANVIISDNGTDHVDAAALCPSTGSVETIILPFDSGLSAARNAIRDSLQTEFLLVMEDDFIVDERCNLAAMLDVLDTCLDVGAVCGLHEDGYRSELKGGEAFGLRGNRFVPISTPTHHTPSGTPFQIVEFAINFALFRREFASVHRWDNALKIGEHLEFYLRVRDADDWLVAFTPASRIGHDTLGRTDHYLQYRRRAVEMRKPVLEKYKNAGPPRIPVEKSQCTIVATPGRSGSSLLSSMLMALGLKMFYRPVPTNAHENANGYSEDLAWYQSLRRDHVSLESLQLLIDLRSVTQSRWGVKAPQLTDHWPGLQSLAWPSDTRIISITRPIQQITESMDRATRRPQGSNDQWVAQRIAAHQRMVASNEFPILHVTYDDLIESPRDSVSRIASHLGLIVSRSQSRSAISLVDPTLRHFF